jgi:hypothetical protein
MKKFILDRLKQESTWRGLIQLVIACGIGINPDQAVALIAVGTSVIGAINVLKKD